MRNRSAPDWGAPFDFLKNFWYNKNKKRFLPIDCRTLLLLAGHMQILSATDRLLAG